MYKKLIEEFLKNQDFPTEQEFNRLFPNLKELDVEKVYLNYDSDETTIISVIIETITNGVLYVIDVYEPDKFVSVDLGDYCSNIEELDRAIKILEDNGWEIDNVQKLYEELEYNLNSDKKNEILNELQNYSYSELKKLMNGH